MTSTTIKATDSTIHEIVVEAVSQGLDDFTHNGKTIDLNHIDVSAVTDMTWLFCGMMAKLDVSKWDVSNVETMEAMFIDAQVIPDVSMWNVSKVTNMREMFARSAFRGDLSKWSLHPHCDVKEAMAGEALFFTKEPYVGELHWMARADVLIEGMDSTNYDAKLKYGGAVGRLHRGCEETFMEYATAIRKIHAGMGSNLYGAELGRAAWEMYKHETRNSAAIEDSIELPADMDFSSIGN